MMQLLLIAVLAGTIAVLLATCWFLWSKQKVQSDLMETQKLLISSLLHRIEGSTSCGSDATSVDKSDASTVIKFIPASTIKEEEFETFLSGCGVTYNRKDDISYPKLDSKNPNHETFW
jgi:hypothetical protein